MLVRLPDEPERLVVNGLSITPYYYAQERDRETNGLFITLRVALAEPYSSSLDTIIKDTIPKPENRWGDVNYFSVVREGVDNAPLAMRFGAILWSENDLIKKYELNLVERSLDDPNRRANFVEYDNVGVTDVQITVAQTTTAFNALLALLATKGIISEAEHREIKSVGVASVPDVLLAFQRVRNIDQWRPLDLSDDDASRNTNEGERDE